jgi:hypothetical protein
MKFTPFCLLFVFHLSAQTIVRHDFDHDGKRDKVYVLQTNQGRRLCYQLTSNKNKTVSSFLFTECNSTSLTYKENKVVATNNGMRFFYYYTFEYDIILKDFKLIRVDAERLGNCVHDASGKSKYDLMTGVYSAQWYHYDESKKQLIQLPIIKTRKPVKLWLLKNYGDDMIWKLAQVDIATQPSCLRKNYFREIGDSHFGHYYPEQKWVFEQYGTK